MSDFIFSSKQRRKGILTNCLKSIHLQDPPDCFEYHGSWGSLGVLYNHYHGFNPYEDERHLMAVIGAPILKFSGAPSFSKTMPQNAKTMAILKKWKKNGGIRWDKDLSGPFAIICIDKNGKSAEIATDMLSFIPIYQATIRNEDNNIVMGTHIDIVSEIQERDTELDEISLVDFFINRAVTFPYTLYKDVSQMPPATITLVENGIINRSKENRYWVPIENNPFSTMEEAAYTLRGTMQTAIQDMCENHKDVAVLLSGGEDSRAVLAAIPKGIKKTGYVFVDSYNREARIAKKIAGIYNADFSVGYRLPTHYLDQIEECSRLVGSQNEFTHVHAYGFHTKFEFKKHEVILGGLKADTFLKGYYIPPWQFKMQKIKIFPSRFRQYSLGDETNINSHIKEKILRKENKAIFPSHILEDIVERQLSHYSRIQKFRQTAVAEWMKIWPISHDQEMTFFNGHRRLFRSFEPFLSSDIVNLAASVPQAWKINRRLFQMATKSALRPSRFVSHAGEGHFPYFSRIPNIPLRLFCTTARSIHSQLNPSIQHNQGPWPNWDSVVKTERMHELIEETQFCYKQLASIFNNLTYSYLLNENLLFPSGKLRVLQVLSSLKHDFKI